MIKIIAAIGRNNELGKSGNLLWDIPEDLQNFKDLTFGGTIVMGRKTWESLPTHPLPGRRNIVLSRDPEYTDERCETLQNLGKIEEEELFVIGGGEIYHQFLDKADIIHLTRVYQSYPEADTFFPNIDLSVWSLFSRSDIMKYNDLKYRFETWIKKN